MRDPTDEVITGATARAEELFDELVDTLAKEDDPLGVGCSLLVQLTRFISEGARAGKELAHGAAWQPTNDRPTRLTDQGEYGGPIRTAASYGASDKKPPDFGDS